MISLSGTMKTSSKSTSNWLYEYDTGHKYSPASEEDVVEFQKALSSGKGFFSKGHHGYSLRFVVKELPSS